MDRTYGPDDTRAKTSKATRGAPALKFIGAVLVFVGLLNGILSARTGSGSGVFEAALFVSGLLALIVGNIKNTRAAKRRAP